MSAAVEIHDLFRVYRTPEGDAAALQGLTLTVASGELLVVLGPSGSGKTTLLRILAGLEPPSAGSVHVFGTDLPGLSRRSRAGYRAHALGYVEQNYWRSLDPHLTARELVGLQLALTGAPRRTRDALADELLERVGLAGKRDARPVELSGGEQQRIAVCAALAHRPALLLADEPTGELDTASARLVYELLAGLTREAGCTTLLVSHDPNSSAVADRTIRVRDGRVSAEARGTGSEAIVVGRGGWLRLPETLLARAGIETRASAEATEDEIVLRRSDEVDRAPGAGASAHAVDPARIERGIAAEVRSIDVRFGRAAEPTVLFEGFEAEFELAKLSVVTGPSGSGKTTLLHLLAGLALPDAGEIRLLGTSLSSVDRAARADFRRAHVAYVSQQLGLIPFLSARENVELGLAWRDIPQSDVSDRALETLAAVGLAGRSEQRLTRLSSGERQRVAIARALVREPAILLADEPTARLDEANALAVAGLFARLAHERGTAIVCATHDQLLAEQGDVVIALDRRRGDGTRKASF